MVEINRVAKVVKGGRRFSFTALVVIGDEVDRVGVGYGKAREVPLAITKAVDDAKKNLFTVPKHGTTITHEIARPIRRGARPPAPGERGHRRDRRRRRARGARARRDPRHPREEPRHDEPDQHGEGDRGRAATAAPPRGRRADPRQDGLPRCCRCRAVAKAAPADEAVPKPVEAAEKATDGRRSGSRRSAAQIGQTQRHRGTLRALGLGKIGRSRRARAERPQLAGMLRKVRHLVQGRGASSVADELNLSNLQAGAAAQGSQARRPRPRLRQGPLLRPRDQGPEVALGLAQDARRLRGRPDADLHAGRQAARLDVEGRDADRPVHARSPRR